MVLTFSLSDGLLNGKPLRMLFRKLWSLCRYTCFGCAILTNHAHLIIRNHPVWSSDQFKKYLSTPDDIDRTIRYVENNLAQSGLSPQRFDFVTLHGVRQRPAHR